ncbi:hypothetical protein ACWKWU_09425 [Chitinophaga lutea]
MKKRSLLVLAAFAGLCLILYACSKELRHPPDQRESASSVVTLAAKQWYAGHTAAPLTAAQKRTPRRLNPLWQKGWMVEGADRTHYFVVPAPERRVNNKDLSIRRFFVFETDGDAVKAGYITELIGVKYDVEKNLDLLLRNHKSNGIDGFTGSIFTYDLNYRALNKKTFGAPAGKKARGEIQMIRRGDQNARKAGTTGNAHCWPPIPNLIGFPDVADDCVINIYIETWWDGDGCAQIVNYYYISHTCPPMPEDPGEPDPEPGGEVGNNPPYGNVFTYVRGMDTDMQSMCYNNMFRILRESQGNWHREVSVLANSLMSTLTLDIYIHFHEGSWAGDYDGAGTLLIGASGTHGRVDLNVTIGTYGLQYASKEILASYMIHGCMDALLDAFNAWPTVNNDDVWAYDYVVGHYTSLLEMFWNMPIGDAEKMGWRGLESTHYYAQDMIDNPGEMDARYELFGLYRTRQDSTGTDCMAAY